MGNYLKIVIYWASLFVGYMLVIIIAGAIVGALFYPLAGILFGMNYSILFMTQKGIADLAFLALIWAPGSAIVLCFIKAHHYKRSGKR